MYPDLFVKWFSLIFSVWDCFLYEGSILLFRIALGVLSINKDLVLSQESSEGIFTEVGYKYKYFMYYADRQQAAPSQSL